MDGGRSGDRVELPPIFRAGFVGKAVCVLGYVTVSMEATGALYAVAYAVMPFR